jgi:hypothetical protein
MTTKEVSVVDNRGIMVTALLMICDNCGGESFHIFVVPTPETKGHNHLQCTGCGESFCQGGC